MNAEVLETMTLSQLRRSQSIVRAQARKAHGGTLALLQDWDYMYTRELYRRVWGD